MGLGQNRHLTLLIKRIVNVEDLNFRETSCQFPPNIEYNPEVMYSIYSWTIGSKNIRGTLHNSYFRFLNN